jgi:ubiquinone/menaquinone biosynthesis C-methylase UbiE
VKTRTAPGSQKEFDFTAPRPRPFLSNLGARIDTYEEGVASYFRWRTGLEYYATLDQIIDFVVNTRRMKVLDCLTDTGTFALRLAGRKGFVGRVFSYDSNITLVERARQRAADLSVQSVADFRESGESRLPVADGFAEVAVSIFDLHRHSPEQLFREAWRVLSPEGYFVLAEMLEPHTTKNRCRWAFKKLHLKYIQKNPEEAEGVYYDREEIIEMVFAAGFRQVIIQGLNQANSPDRGTFCIVAAMK